MVQLKRKCTAVLLLIAFLCAGCATSSEIEDDLSLGYTGSKSFEYFDVGNDRNADYLSGRGMEVCIPLSEEEEPSEEQDCVYALYRVSDNKVLQQYGVMDRIYPASTTKLLTAYVALKYCNLSESVTFSYNASHLNVNGAVLCGFNEGDTIMLRDLLAALLIYSGNDAGIAIAEHVSGSVEAFIELMNEEAKRLGAVDTYFVNPHGLHNREHYSSAYDIYLIMNELIHFNTFLSIISMPSYTVEYTDAQGNSKTKFFESTNLFFSGGFEVPEGVEVIGGKTGTTYAAGCCLILYFKGGDGMFYISEVFGAPTYELLYKKMTELMEMTVSE